MVLKDGSKMSKSKGNTVEPVELINRYGADTARLFTMFAAPPEQSLEWSDSGVEGSFRFLKKLWRLVIEHQPADVTNIVQASLNADQKALRLKTHSTLQKVDDDYGRRQTFNTAVAAVMELVNSVTRFQDQNACSGSGEQASVNNSVVNEALNAVVLMLSPVVPHICHALWMHLGHETPVIDTPWPAVDETALAQDSMQLVVQVNGKLRARIEADKSVSREALEAMALDNDNVRKFTDGKTVRKVIVVPEKLINIVVG